MSEIGNEFDEEKDDDDDEEEIENDNENDWVIPVSLRNSESNKESSTPGLSLLYTKRVP